MRLRELNRSNASRFVGLMEKHGFVVLTEVGAIRKAYLGFMQLLKAFFEGDSDWKETKKGGVHFNERGIPMWHTGYERCGNVREAFRIPIELARPSDSLSPSSSLDPWPCQHLRRAWLEVLRLLQLVCHRALTLTLARPVHGAPPRPVKVSRRPGASPSVAAVCAPKEASELAVAPAVTMAIEAVTGATIQAEGTADDKTRAEGTAGNKKGLQGSGERTGSGERCPVGHSRALKVSEEGAGAGGDGGGDAGGDEGSDDFSVSYALHYPNEFADPALEKEDLTVGEHVDPSLFVAEPCCGVEGLEILDRASESWLPVEGLCAGLGANGNHSLKEAEGRELVLFGGKALERATEARVQGAPHRVRRGRLGRRYCFIYEQKYAEFFPPPALD
eukprot:jgi/Undpi1/10498/HiC_scaffold_29.g12948.m1